jgi:hypothetical protein
LILHDLDRFWRHRELVLVSSAAIASVPNNPPELAERAEQSQKHKEPTSVDIALVNARKEGASSNPA